MPPSRCGPSPVSSRAATEYGKGGNLVQMLKDNLVAERLVIERELLGRYASDYEVFAVPSGATRYQRPPNRLMPCPLASPAFLSPMKV